jgi:uncharacterized protein (TIGR03067 family)
MRLQFALMFGGVLLAAGIAWSQQTISGDAGNLQGTWQVVDLEANGEKKPAEEIQGWKLTFKNDELWLDKPTGSDPKLKFKLDAAQSPKRIDLIVQEGKDKGRVAPGIYALANGQLRLCINIFGNPSYRPREFKTQDQDGTGFVILERVKTQ